MKRFAVLFLSLVACGEFEGVEGAGPVPSGSAEGREPVAFDADRAEPEPDAGAPAREDGGAPSTPDAAPEPDAAPDAGGTSGPVPVTGNENPGCRSYATKIQTCAGAGVQAAWAVSSTCSGTPWRYWSESDAFVEFRPGGLDGCGTIGTVRCCVN